MAKAKASIKETVKAVRSANVKAHEKRMNNCTAAAGTVLMDGSVAPVEVTKVPMGTSGLTKPKAAKKLMLTSPAKMGTARKAKKSAPKVKTPATPKIDSKKVGEKVRLAVTKRVAGIANWTPPKNIDPALAETCAKLFIRGTTSREILNATGLDSKQRLAVDKSLKRAGYAFERQVNPEKVKGDGLTHFIFRRIAPPAAS